MVKLRLKRIGRRKSPFYRLVAIDSRKRRDGREIERLGWYNPIRPGLEAELNEERIRHWLNQGAIPSATVNNLLTKKGINYKIHLEKLGKKEAEIVSLMEEWLARQEKKMERIESKKAEKKAAKKVAAKAPAEEAPAEEAPAEEAPAEEAPKEEAPAEEAPAEEAPKEEASKD